MAMLHLQVHWKEGGRHRERDEERERESSDVSIQKAQVTKHHSIFQNSRFNFFINKSKHLKSNVTNEDSGCQLARIDWDGNGRPTQRRWRNVGRRGHNRPQKISTIVGALEDSTTDSASKRERGET